MKPARILFESDVEYYKALTYHDLSRELDGCDVPYLRALAEHLELPVRFDSGSLKDKDTLIAAIYQHLVR